jgi:hypothetical protein
MRSLNECEVHSIIADKTTSYDSLHIFHIRKVYQCVSTVVKMFMYSIKMMLKYKLENKLFRILNDVILVCLTVKYG